MTSNGFDQAKASLGNAREAAEQAFRERTIAALIIADRLVIDGREPSEELAERYRTARQAYADAVVVEDEARRAFNHARAAWKAGQ